MANPTIAAPAITAVECPLMTGRGGARRLVTLESRSTRTVSITADAFPPSQPTTGLPVMPLPATQEDVLERVRAGGIEFLFAQFVDMHGKPNAKLLPARHLSSLFESGAGFAGFAAGDIGQMPNDPDLEAMPDP